MKVLTKGRFRGFPDLFRTDCHLELLEDAEGERWLVHASPVGSYGPRMALVGYAPADRILLRIEGDVFFDGSFPLLELITPCSGHVWEDCHFLGYDWQQCTVCGCGRPIFDG